jgi:hypothetical protein
LIIAEKTSESAIALKTNAIEEKEVKKEKDSREWRGVPILVGVPTLEFMERELR